MNERQAARVIDLYKEHGTIEAVVSATGLPRSEVTAIVDEIPNREHYRRRGTRPFASPEKLITDLRLAASYEGEPLTVPKYRRAAAELGLASLSTILKTFPDEVSPWARALREAGVKGNPPRGPRKTNITFEQCVDAVAQCWHEIGERPSYDAYLEWSEPLKGRVPSGSTIRLRGWNRVVEAALERLSGVC